MVWDIEFLSSRVGERHVMGEVPTSYARASLPPASILESMDLHGHDEHKIDWQAGGQADREADAPLSVPRISSIQEEAVDVRGREVHCMA